MDKNKKEKEFLLQMAQNHKKNNNCLTMPDKNLESYFTERKEQNCLKEYGFQTVSEFMSLLQQETNFSDNEELLKVLTVATFKNRSSADENIAKRTSYDSSKEVLPTHIYNM